MQARIFRRGTSNCSSMLSSHITVPFALGKQRASLCPTIGLYWLMHLFHPPIECSREAKTCTRLRYPLVPHRTEAPVYNRDSGRARIAAQEISPAVHKDGLSPLARGVLLLTTRAVAASDPSTLPRCPYKIKHLGRRCVPKNGG